MTTNPFYTPSGTPATSSSGASAPMRSEFNAIAAGFALLPSFTGNPGCAVIVNAGGTALTLTTGQLALAGNLTTTGAFNTTLAQTASVTLTLPAVSGTLATLAGTETLSNKTLVSPALGTPASGNLSNCTGTASGLTAGTVTTNANLTGVITSVGNATSIAAQTGTGTTFVMSASPTLVTPALGVATATSLAVGGATIGSNGLAVTGHLLLEGVTSTGATGTGNLVFSASPTLTGTLTAATSSFSGHMTIEGVTSTGATGTGLFVFATTPTVTTLTVSSGGAAITGNTSVASGTFTASGGAFTASPASANVVLSPTGTGVVTINPATAGTIDNCAIGATTARAGTFSALTLSGTMTGGTQTVTGGSYQGALGKINALGSITGSNAISYNSGNYVTATQNSAALTYTFTNWPASGTYGFLEIITALDATPHSVTFTGVTWDTNLGAPTLVASKELHVVLETIDGGATIKASLVGQF